MAGRPAAARSKASTAGSRWNAGKDLSFVPIRMGLVAEVTFGQLENRRFRHGVKFLRWRPDRTPESCRYDQLDVAEPVSFSSFIDRYRHLTRGVRHHVAPVDGPGGQLTRSA